MSNTKSRRSRRPGAKPDPVGIAEPAAPITPPAPPAMSKQARMLVLLQEGATLSAMQAATGWQAHSVRGFISGMARKKLGLNVTVEKTAAGTVYRIGA